MSAFAWILAAVFIVAGVLAYSGRWKGWMTTARGYGSHMGFCLLYLGVAFALGGVAATFAQTARPVFFALVAVAAVFLAVAVVGLWWLPRFLVPGWFRTLRASAQRQGGTR